MSLNFLTGRRSETSFLGFPKNGKHLSKNGQGSTGLPGQRTDGVRSPGSGVSSKDKSPRLYRPGFLVTVLAIRSNQFRHWRSELDPRSTRGYFSYPVLLAYATLDYLVNHQRCHVEDLKRFNTHAFFNWFDAGPTSDEITNALIEVDPGAQTITFHQAGPGYAFPGPMDNIVVIELSQLDAQLMAAFRDVA